MVRIKTTYRARVPKMKFTPTVLPPSNEFKIIIDTREQLPLFVDTPELAPYIVRKSIYPGDYSIYGYEDKVSIERKQMSDLLSFIGSDRNVGRFGYDKTERKLECMREMYFAALVIELDNTNKLKSHTTRGRTCNDENLLYKIPSFSKLTPNHIRGFLTSIQVKRGIHVYYTHRRDHVERWVLDRLVTAYKELRKINT